MPRRNEVRVCEFALEWRRRSSSSSSEKAFIYSRAARTLSREDKIGKIKMELFHISSGVCCQSVEVIQSSLCVGAVQHLYAKL